MLPPLDTDTGNLPPGIHAASWTEIEAAFGSTPWRRQLLDGLHAALMALQIAGCRRAYIDGSFVTSKDVPGDFDGCWEAGSVDFDALDPVLLEMRHPRTAQKQKYGGELFIANTPAVPQGTQFLDFFQIDKNTGEAKGIVTIQLGDL